MMQLLVYLYSLFLLWTENKLYNQKYLEQRKCLIYYKIQSTLSELWHSICAQSSRLGIKWIFVCHEGLM